MKLTVLIDNNTLIDQYYYGEPGASYFIEDEGVNLLLDTGYSDLLLKNARSLGLDLDSISAVAISHGHNDHTGGLPHLAEKISLKEKQIVAHPHAFRRIVCDGEDIGSPVSAEQLRGISNLTLSKEPVKVSPHITFLGEIPVYNVFEKRKPIGACFLDGEEQEDFLTDDSALSYNSGRGLFIITGCSHSGICNIVEHAKNVCGESRILGVIGGLHLFQNSVRLQETIAYFKKNEITELYPCHCVSFTVKAEIHKQIPICEVGVGLTLEIPSADPQGTA